jgi:hypothetical protein
LYLVEELALWHITLVQFRLLALNIWRIHT